MDFVQKFSTTLFGTLLLVFTVAFVSVPYTLGHVGKDVASATIDRHLS